MTSEDDDAPFGPPPDPSQRQWRHPSEIAAAAAAAARYEQEPPGTSPLRRFQPPFFVPSSFLIGGTVGIAVCLAALAITSQRSSDPDPGDVATAAAVASSPITTSADAASSTPEPSTTLVATTLPTTATTAPPTTLVATSLVSTTLSPALEELADELLVSVRLPGAAIPAASGVAVGPIGGSRYQTFLTSAAALDDAATVVVHHGGVVHRAEVAGVDPFTDLAVLVSDQVVTTRSFVVTDDAVEAETEAASETPPVSSDTNRADANPDINSRVGTEIIVLAVDDQSRPMAIEGEVVAEQQHLPAKNGQLVLDLLHTTARLPPSGAGALLLTADGDVLGVVVGGESKLAAATPLDVAMDVAVRLLTVGWASESWIGIEGMDVAGGVELTIVEPEGPAALAGMEPGDRLQLIDGDRITSMADVVTVLRTLQPGDTVTFTVRRGRGLYAAEVVVGQYDADDMLAISATLDG